MLVPKTLLFVVLDHKRTSCGASKFKVNHNCLPNLPNYFFSGFTETYSPVTWRSGLEDGAGHTGL